MTARLRPCTVLLATALLLALSGCAVPRMVDSEVQSFTAAVPAVRPALVRFERLPSQQNAAAQDQIEALAVQALAKVGLTPAPLVSGAISGTAAAAPTARYAVQVSAQVSALQSPYGGSVGGSVGGAAWWRRGDPRWGGFGLELQPTWYRHAVRLVLRDSSSGQVVYETTAHFDGPWADSSNLLPVVLDAALQGYPNPPSGARKVVIELPDSVTGPP
jgi:hypothetical protein